MFLRYFTVIKSQSEGEQFYFGLFDIIGESVTGALGINADFGAQVLLGHMVEPIKNAVFNLFNDIVNGNTGTLITEIGAALIPSPGRIKGAVMSQDFKGDHLQLMKDIDQDVKDFIIAGCAQSFSKMGKSCLTRDVVWGNACQLAV